jgi:predicted membrane protein
MEPNDIDKFKYNKNPRIWSGLLLVIAGLLLLGYKMGAPIPGWIFTWPVLLIGIGLLIGARSNFHNPGSFIMILIGGIFLIDQQIPGIDFHNYIVPIILICVGILFIVRPRPNRCHRRYRRWERMNPGSDITKENVKQGEASSDNEEYIDAVAVFGGIKKNIQSKNFKGGEIVCFMGGAEINLMQADIQHPVRLEINNVFGGTKLIIPSNWDVKNEISPVFGGVEDKRNFNNSTPDTNKRIILRGSCVFGGIELTNY